MQRIVGVNVEQGSLHTYHDSVHLSHVYTTLLYIQDISEGICRTLGKRFYVNLHRYNQNHL